MPLSISAETEISLALRVKADRYPPEPDVGLSEGYFEDIEITELFAERTTRVGKLRVDLLQGVNPQSPDVKRLLENIADAELDSLVDALLNEDA